MSYPAALYMAPPSTAWFRSKTHRVKFEGPVSSGDSSFHTEPEENRATPALGIHGIAVKNEIQQQWDSGMRMATCITILCYRPRLGHAHI